MNPSHPPITRRNAIRPRTLNALGGLCAACVLAGVALMQAGCSSEPLSSDLSILAPEAGRALVGYNDTEYVYPIQVPNSNRYVQMRSSEPLDPPPTYEDYLKWKGK